MKLATKLLCVLALCSGAALAGDRYIVIAMRDDASTADKVKVRNKLQELPWIEWHPLDSVQNMPQWRTASNTNITWRILCLDREKPNSTWAKIPWTYQQYSDWKDANLDAPAKVQIRQANDPESVLRSAGLEPVPISEGAK